MNNISWPAIIALILLVIAIVLIKLLRKNKTQPVDCPYQKTRLFSIAERSFLGVLNQAIGESTKIFSKIRVADVVTPNKGLSRSNWQTAFNKISGKHFDFILCDSKDYSTICAIELNDKSHQTAKIKKRDNFLNKVCDAAELPLIQITAKRNYVLNDIKKLLDPQLNMK